jgi:hypothetical protein
VLKVSVNPAAASAPTCRRAVEFADDELAAAATPSDRPHDVSPVKMDWCRLPDQHKFPQAISDRSRA